MSESRRLYTRAKKAVPSGVNSPVRYYPPYPFFAARSAGQYIWDADGSRYTDFCNGYGALLLGHARKEIIRAVSGQLSRGTLYCAPTGAETELAEAIKKLYPSGRVRLVNTGGEATMTAIRVARGFTGRKKIVKFEGCYHGAHDSVLVRAGSGSAHRGVSVSAGVPGEVSKNTLVARYNDAAGFEAMIQKNRDIACVIIEPILANMGLILPERNFLQRVRKITKDAGIPLIFDEVVTGFRVGPGGAQNHFGVRPDLTTLGKALGGGFAIAAVCGTPKMMDMLSPGGDVYQASTFAGNPVSVSAALASIRIMTGSKSRLYPKLERYCLRLVAALDDMATDLHIPHQINSAASMFQIFFTDTPVTDYTTSKKADAKKFHKMFQTLLRRGVFVAPSQYEVAFLSDAHTQDDLNRTLDAYHEALRSAR
ncbi:MAG: glutamate-1-semialdehyde 2,1-aminomutase [Nitrosopumilus sp. H13]|nr:MAG: glutamate-1-semialdehyde 2,1-aminomutase [Nitrosopumilus sp. H13]